MKQLLGRRVEPVINHLESGDVELGFRKLLDLVRDTQNMEYYKEAVDLTSWRFENATQELAFVDKCTDLALRLSNVEIEIQEPIKNIVCAQNLEKRYGKGKFALGPINLAIDQGKVYGLVGENGNGKTTLLRILGKELEQSKGSITYELDNETSNPYDQRSQLVFIPQRTAIWYGSLKNNLRFVLSNYKVPPAEIDLRVDLMIARLGLWEYRELKWSELSSGYKMRFELARTLLQEPKIMLLDEPLANLDVLAQQVVLDDLKSIAESLSRPIAMILSSQQLYGVEKISDEVVYLKNGKYTSNNQENNNSDLLILELESTSTKAELTSALENTSLIELSYNGGVYIAKFENGTKLNDVLSNIARSNIELNYLRNISNSTRRFFVQ